MAKTNYHLKLKGFVGGYDFDAGYVDYILSKNEGKEVNVLIDSLGGYLSTALSISASFKNHGMVNVHFVGMNASAATISSMGAAHITIDSNAFYLVHKVSNLVWECDSMNADELQQFIDKCKKQKNDLEKMDAVVAEMYAKRCKKDTNELLALMTVGGWLTAKEAKEWGFVDEIDESTSAAPSLTNSMVASMKSAGIPIPNIPVEGEEPKFLEKLRNIFTDFVRKFQNVTTKTETQMKKFEKLCALLALAAINLVSGKAEMTEEQLDTIETALDDLKKKETQINDLQTSVTNKDNEISTLKAEKASLEQQIVELKKGPGASTGKVHDEKKEDEKSDIEEYVDTCNSAKALFDALP